MENSTETPFQLMLDMMTEMIIMRSKRGSLQEKVIDLIVEEDAIAITWLNKDGSIFVMCFKKNTDPRTMDQARIAFATFNYTKEEYEKKFK